MAPLLLSNRVRACPGVEFPVPVPALVIVDLHLVVCCVLCPVTCASCWAAL
jgi:hypothetical protein